MATIESVGSSTRIEGAKLSDVEVEALFGRIKTDAFATRDEQEVAGYAQSWKMFLKVSKPSKSLRTI